MQQKKTFILLSENRICEQTNTFRSYTTLPNPVVSPLLENDFGNLLKWSDNTLVAERSTKIVSQTATLVLILPLIGALEISKSGQELLIGTGQIAQFWVKAGEEISIQNPYENESVNYLEIWLKPQESFLKNDRVIDFSLQQNELLEIAKDQWPAQLFLAKIDGRQEIDLAFDSPKNVFAFVVNGVFELQNCLLETRTALALTDIQQLEAEGLAVDNLLLMLCF